MGRGGQLHEPGLGAPASFLARIQSDDDVSRDPQVSAQVSLRRQLRTASSLRSCQSHGFKTGYYVQVWDLIVVGAGVAGCSLAFTQGQVLPNIIIPGLWPITRLHILQR